MQTVKLNLIPGSVLPVVNVSQYDEKRQFALQVYEGATAYSLSGKSVQIRGTKPDGNGFAYDATDGVVSVSGNTVTISTTQQMTAVGGQTMAELRITSGDTILGTLNFVLMVEPSALSDDTPISDTDIPAIERDFEAALEEAQEAAETATTKAGEAETSATNAGNSATSAAADALKAEGYAVGKQNGVPVGSGSPYYQNNAAYHDTHAGEQAYNASQSATNAGNSATAAAADSLEAEGWAVGEQGGQPVGPTSPYYHNNAAYYAQEAGQHASGGINFKGSLAFADLPTVGMASGDEYNITDDFTTDSRFIEGAGLSVKAGTNIAWVAGNVNKWDILATGGGGADALDDLTDVSITSAADGELLQYNGTSGEWENSSAVPNAIDVLEDVGAINKFNNTATSQTINGVTWTVNSDGTVTADSAGQPATANSFFDISVNGKIATGAYRLTACPTGGSDNTYGASVHYTTGSPWWSGNDTGDGAVLDVKALDYIRLYVSAGVTVSNVLFKPMISDARLNLSYADYQPYAETNPVLTQKVAALEETGSVNLLPNKATSQTINGVTFTVNSDGTITANGTASAGISLIISALNDGDFDFNKYKGRTLRLTGTPSSGGNNKYVVSYYYNDGSGHSTNDNGDGVDIAFSESTPSSANFSIYIWSGQQLNNVVFKPMLSDVRFDLSYDDYHPYAMTNRELTEAVSPYEYDVALSSGVYLAVSGTKAMAKIGKLVMINFAIKGVVADQDTWVNVGTVPGVCAPKQYKTLNGRFSNPTDGTGFEVQVLNSRLLRLTCKTRAVVANDWLLIYGSYWI